MADLPFTIWRVEDLLKHEFPPNPSWIEPAILPKGGSLLIGAQAKVGKSWLQLEFARALTTATPLFDFPEFVVPEVARVLYVEAELGERTTQTRMLPLFTGVPNERLWVVSKAFDLRFDTPEGMDYFERLLNEVRPNVLILDPISFMHCYEENSNKEIGQLFRQLEVLKKLRKDDEMSIILTHHFIKPQKEHWDPLDFYNMRGAAKWKDGADTMLSVAREPSPDRWRWPLSVQWLGRHDVEPPPMKLYFNRDGDFRVRHMRNAPSLQLLALQPETPPKKGRRPSAAKDKQLTFPACTPIPFKL